MILSNKRNVSLDILRIIACFLVVFYHSRATYTGSREITPPISVLNNLSTCLAFFLGRLGVPFFLLISGYFSFNKEIDTLVFLKKRITRIVPPLVLWLFGSTLLIGGTSDFWHNVWNLSCAGHLWYLYTLVGILFIIPIVNPFIVKASLKELLLYLGLWGLTLIFNHDFFNGIEPIQLDGYGLSASNPIEAFLCFYGYFGYYILGFIASKYTVSTKTIYCLLFASVLSWVITIVLLGISVENVYRSWKYLSISVALMTFSIFVVFVRWRYNKHSETIRLISYLTFGCYLVHWIVLELISKVAFFQYVNSIVTGSIVFSISMLISYLISKLPHHKYIIG